MIENRASGSERPPGQVCLNSDCHLDQRWEGFHGLACPECATRLVVACSRCDSPATEEIGDTPFCESHYEPPGVGDEISYRSMKGCSVAVIEEVDAETFTLDNGVACPKRSILDVLERDTRQLSTDIDRSSAPAGGNR